MPINFPRAEKFMSIFIFGKDRRGAASLGGFLQLLAIVGGTYSCTMRR